MRNVAALATLNSI